MTPPQEFVPWRLLEGHTLGGEDAVPLETRFMPTGRQFRVVLHWRLWCGG